ncbi:MAG: heavy metal translocating P-type ATPase [Christensenellales bacterium]
MKKEYNIIGLDCGHCALTLEKYLEKVKGVKSCNINFSTSKLFLEIDDENSKNVIKDIFKTAKQVNPSVKITEDKQIDNKVHYFDIILYVIGLIMGSIVVFVNLPKVWYWILLIISALFMGYKTYIKAILQLKHFKINENTLITISIIGAVAVGESMEGLMVIALYTFGKMLESKAVNYSRKSISSLISNQPEYAVILNGDKETKVKPEVVKINDQIIVRPGEKIALDGIILSGTASVDKKHLTGESEPVVVKVGDEIESGSIVLDSTLVIKVTSEYRDSTVSKILNLVSDASNKKSKTETFIAKFSSWYTLGVIILSIIVWGITWIVLKDLSTAVYRGLIFLVVSCPCAFAISVPLTYFSGIGRCSKQGILIKGSNFLDSCARINQMVFDKTGTLTTGKFQVEKIELTKDIKESEFLDIVVAGEKLSLHPIAKAICEYYKKEPKTKVDNYKEVAGKGIEFDVNKNHYFVGKEKTTKGSTVVAVQKDKKVIGKIYLSDQVKTEAKEAIKELKSLNVKTMMLTGDNEGVAKNVSDILGLDEYRSGLLPEDKFDIIEKNKGKDGSIAFVGDGLNDAPALTLSDVGISMGIMGSPATIEASDVVIADDNLKQLPKLIKISKKTKRIALGNIIFAGITKLTFLTLGALGITGMLFAVFADVGVTLIAILNSLRVLMYKTDK